MPRPTKIVDEEEAKLWYLTGVTYPEFVRRYEEQYGVQTTEAMWSAWRRRRRLPRRSVRDEKLIPWAVKREHRFATPLGMLRTEAQRRAGRQLEDRELAHLQRWLDQLHNLGVVVHYDPDTIDGFYYVPRNDEDTDIIREPAPEYQTQRGNGDLA